MKTQRFWAKGEGHVKTQCFRRMTYGCNKSHFRKMAGKVSGEDSLVITISTFCFSVSAKEFSFFPAETSVILGKVFHGLPQKSERRSGCDPNGNCSQPCKGRAPGTQRRAAALIRRVLRA